MIPDWPTIRGQKRTMAFFEAGYYWSQMRDTVELYVKTCLVCQLDNSVSLDFISALPKSKGFESIMVIVDCFSKYRTFVASDRDCTTEGASRAFFKNMVKLWDLPRNIVSDRDPRFTGHLWTELFKMLGTELIFSTSFHPQSNGHTERVNTLFERYLRHFVSANQHNWITLLEIAQLS